jgi:O-phosphoseryl-tRNA(Cys) synthetase
LNNKTSNVIEVLYTEHCPFWKEVTKTIEEVLKESKVKASVKGVKVSSEDEAKRLRFPGSPTVRINGVDIDPMFKETTGAICCRVYMYQGKIYEYPPKDMIVKAVKRLIKK